MYFKGRPKALRSSKRKKIARSTNTNQVSNIPSLFTLVLDDVVGYENYLFMFSCKFESP